MPKALLLLASLLSFAQAQTQPLRIVSVSPSGAIANQNDAKAVTVVFNQPMVPLTEAEAAADLCPIEFKPKIQGRCRWQGTNVLTYEPEQPLPPASFYRALVPAGVKSLVSGAALPQGHSWYFETLRPDLKDSRPRHNDHWIALDGLLFAHFNLPMDPRKAQPYVELHEYILEGPYVGKIPLAVRRPTQEELKGAWGYYGSWDGAPSTATVLILKPSRQLKPDHAYRVRFKDGLPAEQGELGFAHEREVYFETYYTFAYHGLSVPDCLPGTPGLHFTNPVRYSDLLENLSIQPDLKLPEPDNWRKNHTGGQDAGRRLVTLELAGADLKPGVNYSLRVSGGLKDLFGNPLGSDVQAAFYGGDYCPSFTLADSVGVLENYLPTLHPGSAVNVSNIPLEMLYLTPEDLIPFFNDLKWGMNEPVQLPAWAHRELLDPSPVRNKKVRFGVDLRKALGQRKSGFVYLQARDGDDWHKALVNVTKLDLTVKTSPDVTLVWATFLRNGAPAKGVQLEIRDEQNKVLRTGLTDASGLFLAPGWKGLGIKDWPRHSRPKLWVFGKLNDETTAITTAWKGGLDNWRFNVSFDESPRPYLHEGLVFTERGVYRPGETVLAKGLLRELVNGDWEATTLRTVRVTVKDSRGTEVFASTLPVSALSSFDFSVPTKANAPTGTWELFVTDDEGAPEPEPVVQTVSEGEGEEGGGDGEGEGSPAPAPRGERKLSLQTSFRVEAFKPASFEVKARASKDEYLAGEEFEAVVDGWYLFGAPMAGASYEVKLRLEPGGFAPRGWDGYSFGPGWWEEGLVHYEGRLLASSTGELDEQGKASFKALLDPGQAQRPLAAYLEAGVASPERQRLFGRASAVVHRANLYLGIKPRKTFLDKGQTYSADIAAVRPDGTPVEGLSVEGRLVRRDWLSVQKAGLGGRLEWVTERRDVDVATFSFQTTKATQTWSHPVDAVGLHYLSVSARDEQGRPARAGDSFYVIGKGEAWWERSDNDVVELIADKKSYKPGDTAKILVKSPYERARALVTVERERVLSKQVVWLEGGASFIEVPILSQHVPNIYVGVILLQGRSGVDKFSAEGDDAAKPQAKYGYAALIVDPGGRRLSVSLKTDAAEYRPRGKVAADLLVQDEKGRPVESEAAVFAVDEGVLALTGYATPDPFGAFYGPRPLLVETASLIQYLIGQRSFGEKGEGRGGGGGMAGLDGIDLRSRFVPTAFWSPTVTTGKDGKAKLSFELPDNLSRFRLMAVAQAGRLFGSGESRLTVKKPLLLKPSLPRFARLGDAFQGGIVVHNYTGSSATVQVGLTLRGGAVSAEEPLIKEVVVASGRAAEVLWPMKAQALGEAAFEFRAKAGKETDGLEWKLPVSLPARLESAATAGATEGQAEERVDPPKTARPDLGGLEVSLAATAMTGLQEGARFLLEYPYGCLEQKLSRAFPVLVGADLVSTFGLGDLAALKKKTQEVFDGLAQYQHGSGGFGYWPSPREPDPWITAYALHAAALAKREGYSVDDAVLSKALDWARSYLFDQRTHWAYPYNRSEDYGARAYMLYSLSLHGRREDGALSSLFERRDQLTLTGKAHLLKAAKALGADPGLVEALSGELLNTAKYAPTTLHFESTEECPWTHETSAKTTALVLQALLEAQGGFPADDKAVRWLMEERKSLGRWRTTQENSAVLYALQDYYRRYEKAAPDFTAKAKLAGQEWAETFAGRDMNARRKSFGLEGLKTEGGKAVLSKTGTGRLYYVLRLSWLPEAEKAKSEGFTVEKKVEPLKGPAAAAYPPGSRLVVTLKVKTPQDRTFVAVDDPLPAGFEIVDPSFSMESGEDARALRERTAGARDRWWGGFQRAENYDDRIQVFADFLTAGEHSYSYLVQATTPGLYRMPLTRVEQMYQPEVFALGGGGEVVVGR